MLPLRRSGIDFEYARYEPSWLIETSNPPSHGSLSTNVRSPLSKSTMYTEPVLSW